MIQIFLKKLSLYNLNWSCFEDTVACANVTMPRCVTAVCLCKIIKKSVMGESFVFCPARLDSRKLFLDSRFAQQSRMETRNGLSTYFSMHIIISSVSIIKDLDHWTSSSSSLVKPAR